MSIHIRKKVLLISVILLSFVSFSLITLQLVHRLIQVKPQLKQTAAFSSDIPSKPTNVLGDSAEYTNIKNTATNNGVKAAWQYIIDTFGKDNAKQLVAHEYAHYVGNLIYAKEGLNGMTICTANFAFGCYHGLLDQAFRKDLSLLSQAEKACKKVGDVRSGPYASCIHGIGHGVASYYRDKDLTKSLKTCDKLPEGAPQFCYDGVFMEFSRDALDSFYKPNDLLYPCNNVATKYIYACGRNQPSVLMTRMHKSFIDVARACQKATDTDLKTSCFVALGFQTVYMSNTDPQKIISTCESLKDIEFEYQCKSAAAGELIFQGMADWQTNSPRICNSLSEDKRKTCLRYLDTIKKNYNRN